MLIGITTSKTATRRAKDRKRYWHRRTVLMRFITIGGYGTDEPQQRRFIIAGRLWARRSQCLDQWLFATKPPTKTI